MLSNLFCFSSLCCLHCLQNPQKPRKNNHEVIRKVDQGTILTADLEAKPTGLADLILRCSQGTSYSSAEENHRGFRSERCLLTEKLREDCLVLTSWSLANPETKSSCRTQQRGRDRGRQKVAALMCKVIF